jgi:hypothetical protein
MVLCFFGEALQSLQFKKYGSVADPLGSRMISDVTGMKD